MNFRLDFRIQWFSNLVWYVSRIRKSHPIWMRLKVVVNSPLSALCVPFVYTSPFNDETSNFFLHSCRAVSFYIIVLSAFCCPNMEHPLGCIILPKVLWYIDYPPGPNILTTNSSPSEIFLKILHFKGLVQATFGSEIFFWIF